jgi:hypothetical protein
VRNSWAQQLAEHRTSNGGLKRDFVPGVTLVIEHVAHSVVTEAST